MAPDNRLDDLTAREREVLDLVRLGLTNEEIAGRLGITDAGIKYHVSQILSKLGVATREEAAAVMLVSRRRWWAMLPLAAKATGVAVIVAAVAGLGLLAWGVVRTSGDGEPGSASPAYFLRVPRSTNDPPRPQGQFAVCVQSVDVDVSFAEQMKANVEGLVLRLGGRWTGQSGEPVVDIGCPYPPTDFSKYEGGRLVDSPSYYSTYVFILPPEKMDEYFRDQRVDILGQTWPDVRIVDEETEGGRGDVLVGTAYGLYLTPDALADQGRYLYELYWALGAGPLTKDSGGPTPYQGATPCSFTGVPRCTSPTP